MRIRLIYILKLIIIISCGTESYSNFDDQTFRNSEKSLVNLIDSLGIKKKDLTILISKSDYKLSVLTKNQLIKEYPVVFGTNPIDDKLMEGDRCTPEGGFMVQDFYPHKSWSKFIWIDYPTQDSWKKHKKAKSENRIPENATIGGEIGIHGVPDNNSSLIAGKNNWTWGCISMTNEDVNDLYKVVHKNMRIEITK